MSITWDTYDRHAQTALADAFRTQPDEWIAAHGVALKTSGVGRDIFRVNLSDESDACVCVVKRFELQGRLARLRWRFNATPPQKEWRMLTYCTRHDVAVPRPIAMGWRTTSEGIRVWLVCAYSEGCITFDALPPPRDMRVAQRYADRLAELLARMHVAGVCHRDVHAGNILFNQQREEWLITDFQHARHVAMSRKHFIHDLVQLNHCMGKKVPVRVRLAFLHTYLTTFSTLLDASELAAWERHTIRHEIAKKTRHYTIHQGMSRSRRYTRKTRDIMPLSLCARTYGCSLDGVTHGFAVRGISQQLLSDLIALVTRSDWFLDDSVAILKNTRSVAAGVWTHPQGRIFVKQYRWRKSWRDTLSRQIGRSKAQRTWVALWRFKQLHIRVPAPLFVCRHTTGTFVAQEYVDARSIEAALRVCETPKKRDARTAIIRAAAQEIGLMHDRGIAHGDLKASNVFVKGDAPHTYSIYLSDVDAARFYRAIPWHERIRDLARLYAALYPYVSNAETRFFLRVYMRYQLSPPDTRSLIDAVISRAERKIFTKHGIRLR